MAARAAGHTIVGVLSRSSKEDFGPALDWDADLPNCDVLIIAVRDDAIAEVAERLAAASGRVAVAAHMSGFTPVTALQPISAMGVSIGGFHPLQTLPDPMRGSQALAGSYVGIGGEDKAVAALTELGTSLSLHPFSLPDASRPAYHAAAAAASNFVITSLATSGALFQSAEIDPAVSKPLVERAVANVFESWPDVPLTGPIARGDTRTVLGHLQSADSVSAEIGRQFRLMSEATAILAGRETEVPGWS